MNRLNRCFLLSLTLLFITASLAQAQRIPVTTASEVARDHYTLALTRVSHVDFDAARAHLDKALDADPAFALAHIYRAWLAPPADRAEHLRQAQSARVSDAERHVVEAYAAHHDGDHDREIELMAALYEQHPDDADAAMWLGSELYSQERYDEAASVLRRVLAADAANPGALNMLGYTLKESGDAAGAEQAFLDYIRVASNEGNPYDSYGEFLLDAGRLDEAEAQFTKALARAPNLTASQNHLTRIAIMRATDGFVAAVNNGDLDAYMDFYTANAVMSMPNGTELVGRDAIREAIGALFASGPVSIESETQENVPMGDEHVYQRTALTTHIGGVTEQGTATHIWVQTDDGWKITRDTWTSAPATPATTVANPVDNRAIVETAYANFAAGDVEAFLSILDPDVTWTDAEGYPYAGTYVGPDALLAGLIARIGAEWDAYTAVPTTYIAEGDRVVALGDYSGTYKATGRSVEAPFTHVWQFVNGKVVSFRQFTDGPPWQRAIAP